MHAASVGSLYYIFVCMLLVLALFIIYFVHAASVGSLHYIFVCMLLVLAVTTIHRWYCVAIVCSWWSDCEIGQAASHCVCTSPSLTTE